jgi:hypothetical protein
MTKRGGWVPVKRGDHERVLITDTLPFETPVIFSGDGFYNRLKGKSTSGRILEDLVDMLVLRKGEKSAPVTIPFSYKIRHRVSDFRKLGVLHPSALWAVKEFYGKFDEWMIFECSRSPISIRAPFKVSGTYYERSDSNAVNQFKLGQVRACSHYLRASTIRTKLIKARKTTSSFSNLEKMRRKPFSLRKSRSTSLRFL